MMLVNAVALYHISISSKYVVLSDVIHWNYNGPRIGGWAVHEKELNNSDVSLLLQVAEIVSPKALPSGLKRLLLH